jgi:hypothetical protein
MLTEEMGMVAPREREMGRKMWQKVKSLHAVASANQLMDVLRAYEVKSVSS